MAGAADGGGRGEGERTDHVNTGMIGPVVKMCDEPDCGGINGCERIRRDVGLGLSDHISPPAGVSADDLAVAVFQQELTLNYATDSNGVKRMIPDGCEFTVHKSPDVYHVLGPLYAAVYSGTAITRDEVLADAPEWNMDEAMTRRRRMQEAGVLPTMTALQCA